MESDYAEENLSTKQQTPREKARLQSSHGNKKWPCGPEAPPRERAQAINSSALLGFRLPKESRLRRRAEFLRVYENGRRIEGRFMTVFILPNKLEKQRVGVTATKKAIGKAHDRNRAKRLLRESFRLSRAELDAIPAKYDWVLNARRSILYAKLDKPLAEFRQIVGRLKGAKSANTLPPTSQGEVGER
jgi:ribonuclease P protein component